MPPKVRATFNAHVSLLTGRDRRHGKLLGTRKKTARLEPGRKVGFQDFASPVRSLVVRLLRYEDREAGGRPRSTGRP